MTGEPIMPEWKPVKLKICLVGELAVGKTCLVRRYVFDEFDNKYLTTIGAKTVKKEIKIKHPKDDRLVDVHLVIWDIMGAKGFRQLLQQAYFFGAQGIIAVCDNTREKTLSDLQGWLDSVQNVTKEIPTVFLGNKCDILDEQQVGLNELKSFASGYEQAVPYLSSAKTGRNVELAFKTLGEKILEDILYSLP